MQRGANGPSSAVLFCGGGGGGRQVLSGYQFGKMDLVHLSKGQAKQIHCRARIHRPQQGQKKKRKKKNKKKRKKKKKKKRKRKRKRRVCGYGCV